ncbi:serine/threonine-protein kinase [Bryobacter aggregatus]|uniref:serine/threonine-protein kinase n=1 Tax=Bryobacter aggregatus TaxID=360054 RepID=UPI0004E245FC|nr:serine/threonine-protein kinase [Bryobacter aggregatus]
MTTSQWYQIQPRFAAALDQARGEDEEVLDRELGLDRELHGYARRVLRLVRSHSSTDAEELPEEISIWRLILPLASDGLGTDYLAERADGSLDRMVCFKASRILLDGATAQQQFVQDMRELAMLYDNGIARVLDSGWVVAGRPFVVSEFESGKPITEALQTFGTREKLTVFLRVLSAVGYAHQREILHGDLKPANILVGREQTPRLIDFGLARVFAKGGDPIGTQQNLEVASLAYLAPEQIRGTAITPATDVYTLGVILYELLSGEQPYGPPTDNVIERGRAICERILPQIEGIGADLNYIIAKATEKNREARYPDVMSMGKDIEAYLECRAVRPITENAASFALKILRQYWITTTLLVAVLGTASVAVLQRGRSQTQNSRKPVVAESKVQASSVESAKAYLDDMLAKNADKPEVVGELAKAYLRMAEVERKGSVALGGNRGAAIQSARKAYELTAKLITTENLTDAALLEYAKSARMLSELLNDARDYQEAIRVAQAWKEKFVSISSTQPDLLKAKAAADAALSDLLFAAGEQAASMPLARSAMQQFGVIYAADKKDRNKAADYARSANQVGNKALSLGDLVEALNVFRTAEAVLRPHVQDPESEVTPLIDLAKTLNGLGETLARSKQAGQALASYREARLLLEQAAKKEAGNDEVLSGLADNLIRTAQMQGEGPALEETARAIEMLRKLLLKPEPKAEYHKQLAQALTVRGELYLKQRKSEAARESFEEALSRWNSYGRLAGWKPQEEQEILRLKGLTGH